MAGEAGRDGIYTVPELQAGDARWELGWLPESSDGEEAKLLERRAGMVS